MECHFLDFCHVDGLASVCYISFVAQASAAEEEEHAFGLFAAGGVDDEHFVGLLGRDGARCGMVVFCHRVYLDLSVEWCG